MLLADATSALLLLAVLACPIGMGLMMLFMARGMRGEGMRAPSTEAESLPELKAEQARLANRIESLERARTQVDPDEQESAEPSRAV